MSLPIEVSAKATKYVLPEPATVFKACSPREERRENVRASLIAKKDDSSVDHTTQKRNILLLKDSKCGSMSMVTLAKLVEETFPERRNFIQTVAGSCAEILDMCPYLGSSDHVSLQSFVCHQS